MNKRYLMDTKIYNLYTYMKRVSNCCRHISIRLMNDHGICQYLHLTIHEYKITPNIVWGEGVLFLTHNIGYVSFMKFE